MMILVDPLVSLEAEDAATLVTVLEIVPTSLKVVLLTMWTEITWPSARLTPGFRLRTWLPSAPVIWKSLLRSFWAIVQWRSAPPGRGSVMVTLASGLRPLLTTLTVYP